MTFDTGMTVLDPSTVTSPASGASAPMFPTALAGAVEPLEPPLFNRIYFPPQAAIARHTAATRKGLGQ